MQRNSGLFDVSLICAGVFACFGSSSTIAEERVTQVTLFRSPSDTPSSGIPAGTPLAALSKSEISVKELQDQLAACQAENQLRKDKRAAATSEAIVELSDITNSAKVPDIFTIFGEGAEIRFLTTDARVSWYPFSTKKPDVPSASQAGPTLMGTEASSNAVALDSQRLAIDIAEKLGTTKGQTQAILTDALQQLKAAGEDAEKMAQVVNRLNSLLKAVSPVVQQQQNVTDGEGDVGCDKKVDVGGRELCISGTNSSSLTYRQPSVPWAIEYWVDEATTTIHAFVKITNLTAYPWEAGTVVVLMDTTESNSFLRFKLNEKLFAEHSGAFPAGSFSYADEQRTLNLDASPQILRSATVQNIPNLFPSSTSAVFISQLSDGTKIHRKGEIRHVKGSDVTFGVDFGISVEKSDKLSLSSLESFNAGIIFVRQKSQTNVKLKADADRIGPNTKVGIKKKIDPSFAFAPSPSSQSDAWDVPIPISQAATEIAFTSYSSSDKLKQYKLGDYLGTLTDKQKNDLADLRKLIGVECDTTKTASLTDTEARVLRCLCLISEHERISKRKQELNAAKAALEQQLHDYDIDTRSVNSEINRIARQSLRDRIRSLSESIETNESNLAGIKNELTVLLASRNQSSVAAVSIHSN